MESAVLALIELFDWRRQHSNGFYCLGENSEPEGLQSFETTEEPNTM